KSVPCPQGDGTCTVPDPAVVVTDGQLAVVGGDEVERMFPAIDLDTNQLRPLPVEQSHDDLLRLAEVGDERATGAANEILRAIPGSSGVIVHCTCGHLYVLDTLGEA